LENLSSKEYRHWRQEKELIPDMIRMYCHGHHNTGGKAVCSACEELTEYAVFRLEKCPFKKNKQFCSFCSVHCYKPDRREQIKAVMRYAGPRMLLSHPVFAMSHVAAMLKYKRQQRKSGSAQERAQESAKERAQERAQERTQDRAKEKAQGKEDKGIPS